MLGLPLDALLRRSPTSSALLADACGVLNMLVLALLLGFFSVLAVYSFTRTVILVARGSAYTYLSPAAADRTCVQHRLQ